MKRSLLKAIAAYEALFKQHGGIDCYVARDKGRVVKTVTDYCTYLMDLYYLTEGDEKYDYMDACHDASMLLEHYYQIDHDSFFEIVSA